ncbi:MAG: LPS export ABC transporter periplasmic protein LptC [Granulosicoccus sp.]
MLRGLSKYWLLLPLLIVAVVAVDRIEEPAETETEATIDMRETQSDYYLSDFVTRKFDADGYLEYVIRGTSLAHYPEDDHSRIANPHLELHREGTSWSVRSDAGRYDARPDLFRLHGEVIVVRDSEHAEPVTMKTESLTVSTQLNRVSTEEKIEIIASTWQLQATGLDSALDDGRLQLLSNVTARYELPSQAAKD